MNVSPKEFLLWLNGAAGVIGETPPTPEQWAVIRDKIGDAVGTLVAERLAEESRARPYSGEMDALTANKLFGYQKQNYAPLMNAPAPSLIGAPSVGIFQNPKI